MSKEWERAISSETLRPDDRVARKMMEAREGAYLSVAKLAEMLGQGGLTEPAANGIKRAIRDINERGKDSLYHVCLPTKMRSVVYRRGHIHTISELRNRLDEVGMLKGIGRQSLRIFNERWQEFDKLCQETKVSFSADWVRE